MKTQGCGCVTVLLGDHIVSNECWGNACPVMWNCILEDVTVPEHHCEKLKTLQELRRFKYVDC
jgi:hypothetical protein